MAERVLQEFIQSNFEEFFTNKTVLASVPGHEPISPTRELTIGELICRQFYEIGLGGTFIPLLSRATKVQKSAYSLPGQRPDAKVHYDSLLIDPSIAKYERILLVDDIVTRGCTLMGSALRVIEEFPKADVRAFALMRTMSFIPDIDEVLAPCEGTITLESGSTVTVREP